MLFNSRSSIFVWIAFITLVSWPANSFEIRSGRLIEDFSTHEFADFKASTGHWSIVDRAAKAGVVANGDWFRRLDFGDGSDGVLITDGGYTFNTDSKPNGYNFVLLSITGGSVAVIGRHPLIIRSLSTITITPTLSVDGEAGYSGESSSLSTLLDFRPPGHAVTSSAHGGEGGAANPSAKNGSAGKQYDGAGDSAGAGGVANGGGLIHGNSSIGGAGADFDRGGFIAGAGGGGGGGHSAALHSSGGSGGAGGGTVQIVGAATVLVGTINARGGDGGSGKDEDGVGCSGNESGNGAGGNGGAVWIQSAKAVSAANPDTNGGNGGSGVGCGIGSAGTPGPAGRADGSASTGALALTYNTANAAPNESYLIHSKPYDLGTLNAAFSYATYTAAIPSGGNVSVAFAGSVNGIEFSPWEQDIQSLSNRNYRYLKFQIRINTATAAGASPYVSRVMVDFHELGQDEASFRLSPGCGFMGLTLQKDSDEPKGPRNTTAGALYTLLVLLFWFGLYGFVRKVNRLVTRTLPT